MIGDLRWGTPQTPPNESGVQQATEPPQACPQAPGGNSTTSIFSKTPQSKRQSSDDPEDCLFLKYAITACHDQRSLTEDFKRVYPWTSHSQRSPCNCVDPRRSVCEIRCHDGILRTDYAYFLYHRYVMGDGGLINNGADLIQQSGAGVIVVSIHYRLGLFGGELQAKGVVRAMLIPPHFRFLARSGCKRRWCSERWTA